MRNNVLSGRVDAITVRWDASTCVSTQAGMAISTREAIYISPEPLANHKATRPTGPPGSGAG